MGADDSEWFPLVLVRLTDVANCLYEASVLTFK